MARIGLVGPTYSSQSVIANAQRCINFYPEQDESGEGKSPWALYGTPGPVRALYYNGNRCFATSGGAVYELHSDGTFIELFGVANDGLPAYFAASVDQLLVVSGLHGYCVDTLGNLTIDPPGLVSPLMTDYCDGYFVVLRNDGEWQVTLDGTIWDGLLVSKPSVFSEVPTALICDHREVFILSGKRGVFYQNTGNSFPFDVIPGALTEMGIEAPASLTRFDDSFGWIGEDERGGGIAWKAQGQTPRRISNHSVENFWNDYPTRSDAIGWSYQEDGHIFWVLYFPTAKATWAFDATTGMWHERTRFNTFTALPEAHLGRCHAFAFGRHLVGSRIDGKIYQMRLPIANGTGWDYVTDAGELIHRIRRAPHISKEGERIRLSQLQIDMEVGLGPQPPLQGQGIATVLYLADAGGTVWAVTILDDGMTFQFAPTAQPAQVIVLNEPGGTTTWQLGLTTDNPPLWDITGIALDPTQPTELDMVSAAGTLKFAITVTFDGFMQTTPAGYVEREPQLTVRWSNDGSKTWSGERIVGCGKSGDFKRRAITRRLGASRDRVFEIEVSDPIPWRIVEADIKGDDYTSTERLIKQAGKSS
jgi:hypothetical protein